MKLLYEAIDTHNSIVIFGASDIGCLLYDEINAYCESKSKPLIFADNSYKKWSENTLKPVLAAEKHPNALWIVATDMKTRQMTDDCRMLGIPPENIFTQIPNTILNMRRSEQRLKRITPQGFPELIEVDLCHHCNLNCAGCSAFSPLIAEPQFADSGVFENDIMRLSALLNGNLGRIHLMGGEPLLHPEISEFIRASRKAFPQMAIKIVTNGVLLDKMPDSFWSVCKEQEAIIAVTRYPLKLDFDMMKELAGRNSVKFEFFGIAVEKSTYNLALDPNGKQNSYESFVDCQIANECIRLKNGKLATCSLILNIDFFNQHFDTDLQVCPNDYIDIYKAQSGSEIMSFLAHPVPFCRYCDINNRTYDNPWHISERSVDDWVVDDRL
jgi:organic radical activating enzyme